MTSEPQPHFCYKMSCPYNTHIHSPKPGDRKWVCGIGDDPETCAMMTVKQPEQSKPSRCPYQCVLGGIIGEYVFPECLGKECACYIVFSGICERTGQKIRLRVQS
jgi:hypothetical protein